MKPGPARDGRERAVPVSFAEEMSRHHAMFPADRSDTREARKRDDLLRWAAEFEYPGDPEAKYGRAVKKLVADVAALEAELAEARKNVEMWSRLAHENAHKADDMEAERATLREALAEAIPYVAWFTHADNAKSDDRAVADDVLSLARAALVSGEAVSRG
jgi:hypothetical protein